MKRELIYAASVGGCVGALMTMALGWVLPLGAQNEVRDAAFRKITCKEIEVVDDDSRVWIFAGPRFAFVNVHGKDSAVVRVLGGRGGARMMSTEEHDGIVSVFGNSVSAYDKDHKRNTGAASMAVNEYGGAVSVLGKDGEARGVMSVNEYDNGTVSTWDKNGYRLATLK